MRPKLSKSAAQLREQIDDSYPNRDRRTDGWIGDAKHNSKSDHTPDALGWVRAIDISRNLSGKAEPDIMPGVANQLRSLFNI